MSVPESSAALNEGDLAAPAQVAETAREFGDDAFLPGAQRMHVDVRLAESHAPFAGLPRLANDLGNVK